MDINSLLSPQTSSENVPTTAGKGSPSGPRPMHPSSLTPTSGSSPKIQAPAAPPVLPHSAIAQAQQQTVASPPVMSSSSGRLSSTGGTPLSDDRGRQPSTPGMDTLADLASMQHHQPKTRGSAMGPRSTDLLESRQLPSVPAYSDLPGHGRPRPSPRPSIEHTSSERSVTKSIRRSYHAASLSQSDLAEIASVVSDLAANSYQYQSHIRLIGLLRKGLMAHIQPSSDQPPDGDPHGYELLPDLRQARESMESRFPLGEELWAEWIADEIMLARNVEDRVGVIELCQRATAEELGSIRLWLIYGDWVLRLYDASRPGALGELISKHGLEGERPWSEEDRAVGVEVFTWDMLIDVWRQGVRATELRMQDGHLLWDRYAELLLEDLANGPNQKKVSHLKSLFEERLRTPHATWDQTFQLFSTFVTNYDNATYEETMVSVSQRSADAKSKYAMREPYELRLRTAAESQDEASEWTVLSEYLDFEMAQVRKARDNFRFCNALFERALLRFATSANLWEDYVSFLVDQRTARGSSVSPLPVLQRATRHCPWSGDLWAQYLLSSESENKPFQEVEEVKHKATSMGLMDIGGMEEVLKAYSAWCCYLNRRAFHTKATDEEADVAEVGIRSAIETVKELGETKHGKDYAGDPNYRLQRIYIEYLSRSGLWERARSEVWKVLVPSRGDSYEFWLRWYHWEMMYWFTQSSGGTARKSVLTPSAATSVLRQALTRPSLDWPEKVLEVYMDHAQGYESVDNLQAAVIFARKVSKTISTRRQHEAEQAAQAAQSREAQAAPASAVEEPAGTGKRKRDVEPDTSEEHSPKKSRQDSQRDQAAGDSAQEPSDTSAAKRDREHTTIIIRNLPKDVSEIRVRQFFRDCGRIKSLKLVPESDEASTTATIEFETMEDVLAAETRDMKEFDGNSIAVQVGTGTTVFVTNFPPTADEAYIRDFFNDYGELVDVRFPSLRYNTHRRFCYVQFKTSSQADQAIQLDGTEVGKNLKLVVKKSDPARKEGRKGPVYEGREIYVSNLDWSATEEEVDEVFKKYGAVERVRIPRNVAGKSKGVAFVVFATQEEAQAALDMNNTKFKSRLLTVLLSASKTGAKSQATAIIKPRQGESPLPSAPGAEQQASKRDSEDTPMTDAQPDQSRPSRESLQSRTVALMNIPDTVNDARIRALMEPYGALTKIVLRPDHQGAIVEYVDTKDAGRAALGVEGKEIVSGRRIAVGSVKDLLAQTADRKEAQKSSRTSKASNAKPASKSGGGGAPAGLAIQQSGPIKRPAQPGARRGGRGGLGIKGGGVGLSSVKATTRPQHAPEDTGARGDTSSDVRPHPAGTVAGQAPSSATTTNGQTKDIEMEDQNHDQNNDAPEGKDIPAESTGTVTATATGAGRAGGKSNADFKAMFLNR